MAMSLTRAQKETLNVVAELTAAGEAPSLTELAHELDLATKSSVHRLLTALVVRGYLRRLPARARAMEVLVPPPPLDTDVTFVLAPELQQPPSRPDFPFRDHRTVAEVDAATGRDFPWT